MIEAARERRGPGGRAWIFLAMVAAAYFAPVTLSAQESATPPPPCSAPEYRQFDFWIGKWDVTEKGKPAGTSRVTAILDGCVLLEEWTSANGKFLGKSFNRYDADTQRWQQLWVDNQGKVLRLVGGYADGKMVLEGATAASQGQVFQRITWHNNDDGTVRQVWEQSKDMRETWNTVFDGLYVKQP